MAKIIDAIRVIDKKICKNIEKFDASEIGILSQNILSDLRDLVEHRILLLYKIENLII